MKKLMLLAVIGLLFCAANAFAACTTEQCVTITVTIGQCAAISIDSTTWTGISINAGETSVIATGINVTNIGSGIPVQLAMRATNASCAGSETWTLNGTAGTETYALWAQFNTDPPAGDSWNQANMALTNSNQVSTGEKFAGDETGVNVPFNNSRKLWLQLYAPIATAQTSQQTITYCINGRP